MNNKTKTTQNINAGDWKHAMNNLASTISTDDSRPILRYVNVTSQKDKIVMKSLDGFKMTEVVIKNISDGAEVENAEFEVNIPIVKVENKDIMFVTIAVSEDGKDVTISQMAMGGYPIIAKTYRAFKGDYVNTDQIKPNHKGEDSLTIHLSPKFLAKIMKDISANDRDYVTIKMQRKDSTLMPIEFFGDDKGTNCVVYKLLLPVRVGG